MAPPERYAFGSFVLDLPRRRVLDGGGRAVALSPRLFSALLLFVERSGELLDKDAMLSALWPGLVVEENNLNQVVAGLRRALGDDAHGSRFIQTVPRRGFRFVAPVTVLPPSAELPHRGRRRQLALAATLAAAGLAWWAGRHFLATPAAAQAARLAVLPFRPLSDGPGDAVLGRGMSDSLVARMSGVPGLVVLSTGSVPPSAGADPLRAAHELEAAWVVDGSLQRQGSALRATARLLRASDGTAVWSGSFDENMRDMFDVQDRMARRLVEALAPVLRPGAAGQLRAAEAGGTRNVEAYQLYLTANWRGQDGSPGSLETAIALLHQALELDPRYAQAWTMLAWSHRRRLWNADAVPGDVFEAASFALRKALALQPDFAPARAGQGFGRYWFDFDWPGAEREFRAALALDPAEVSAHHGLALLLATQDRIEEGLAHVRMARELEPMSPTLNTLEASYLLDDGRLEEARVRLQRALDVAPQLWLAHVAEGLLHFADRQPDAGIAAFRRAVKFGAATSRPRAMLGVHLARVGQRDEARAILDELVQLARTRFVTPTSMAALHAALGETEPALAALERAVRVRDTRLIFLKNDPHWAGLRQEPRFARMLVQLKLDRVGRGLTPV